MDVKRRKKERGGRGKKETTNFFVLKNLLKRILKRLVREVSSGRDILI